MPPLLDLSSALPWLGAGFLAGIVIFWLARLIFGIDRRRRQELASVQVSLEDAQRNVSELSNKAAGLEAEWARLMTELGQLQPRAALVPQFEQQLAEMQKLMAAREGQLNAAGKELAALRDAYVAETAALRHDGETHSSTAKYYESEFNRLFSEHEAINKNALAVSNELVRTKAGLEAASRDASEAVRLRSEIASAKANITALQAELEQRKAAESGRTDQLARLGAEYEAKLKAAVADAESVASQSKKDAEELARLKTQMAAALPAGESGAEFERLKSEIATLTVSLEEARAAEQAASAAKQAQHNEFLQARTSLEESSLLAAQRADEIATLKAQLSAVPAEGENFRRYKEALEAANRIIAGQSS